MPPANLCETEAPNSNRPRPTTSAQPDDPRKRVLGRRIGGVLAGRARGLGEDVDLFARLEGPLDRPPGAVRATVPERDQHVRHGHQAAVALYRALGVAGLFEG